MSLYLLGCDVIGAGESVVSDTGLSVIPWEPTGRPDLHAVATAWAPLIPATLADSEIERYWKAGLDLDSAIHSSYGTVAAAGQVSFKTLDAAVADLRGEWDATTKLTVKQRRALRFVLADRLVYVTGRAADAYQAKFGATGDIAGAVRAISQTIGKTIGSAAGGLAGGAVAGAAAGIPWWVWIVGGVAAVGAVGYVAFPFIAPALVRRYA